MSEPAAELVALPDPVAPEAAPQLSVVPVEWRRVQRTNIPDGWVLVTPIAGVAVGAAINTGGVFGVAGSVVAAIVGSLAYREVSARVRVWERGRAARNRRVGYRKALPMGGDG